jgi:hypothetical protein
MKFPTLATKKLLPIQKSPVFIELPAVNLDHPDDPFGPTGCELLLDGGVEDVVAAQRGEAPGGN